MKKNVKKTHKIINLKYNKSLFCNVELTQVFNYFSYLENENLK